MKSLNWGVFEARFSENLQAAFERLAYALFCSMHNKPNGVFAKFNQRGIETTPIKVEDKLIGFQAKYINQSIKLPSRKQEFINSIKTAKQYNPDLSQIDFYVNKTYGESHLGQKPKYILEIEQVANDLDIFINWQVPSQIMKQLSLKNNLPIRQDFFPDDDNFIQKSSVIDNNNPILEITKTAIIQLKIEKIGFKYFNSNKVKRKKQLLKISKYYDFTNDILISTIYDLFEDISIHTRNGISIEETQCIFEGLLSITPINYNSTESFEKRCLEIGFNIAYDAMLYLNHMRIFGYGMLILKFSYRIAKLNQDKSSKQRIIDKFDDMARALTQSKQLSGNEKNIYREFIKHLENDLDTFPISFPSLPNDIIDKLKTSHNNGYK